MSHITGTTPLTFTDKHILDSGVVDPAGMLRYTTGTTRGFVRRKVTNITGANGIVGTIDWREKAFTINGVQRRWDEVMKKLPGGGRRFRDSTYEWNWSSKQYRLEYHNSHKELLATSTASPTTETVRFVPASSVPFHHDGGHAVMYMPPHLEFDQVEEMFILIAILYTDVHRQDMDAAATAAV
ncbi:hypothetical protein GGX14DRAFT_696445 [Mycena pura]|uniref:DUF6593 domain-containing protein n=1 Tax=Mycena pura TaxID=153505 RepID=A0AAD6YJP1_9AGAR|nr:hypothetical protein GGX14DRAFT_696445 [Mycena pura]